VSNVYSTVQYPATISRQIMNAEWLDRMIHCWVMFHAFEESTFDSLKHASQIHVALPYWSTYRYLSRFSLRMESVVFWVEFSFYTKKVTHICSNRLLRCTHSKVELVISFLKLFHLFMSSAVLQGRRPLQPTRPLRTSRSSKR